MTLLCFKRLLFLAELQDLLRICRDQAVFVKRGDDLDGDVLPSCEEDPFSLLGIEQVIFFAFRQVEEIFQNLHRSGRLLEKQLPQLGRTPFFPQ